MRKEPKRDLLGFMLRLSDMRKKQEEKGLRSLFILQRLTIAAIFILMGINTLLSVDLYLLPLQKIDDAISEVVSVSVKGSTEYRMETRDGRYIKISPNGYESQGDKLQINRTPVFHIPVLIYLKEKNIYITRSIDGFKLARYASLSLLFLGALALFFRRKILNENYFVMFALVGITIGQILLLII